MDNEVTSKLLIVDDDAAYIMELGHMLQSEYDVYSAKDGKSAIKKAEKLQPDLILLDIVMPEMSGFEVFDELKSNSKTMDIPVVFITALDSSEDELKGLQLGAADYVVKPFNSIIVKHKISIQMKIINMQRELKALRDR